MTEEKKQLEEETKNATDIIPVATKKRFALGHLFCGSIIFLFYFILILFFFLLTGFGQRSTIQLADKLVDNLKIESVIGSVQDGLIFKNVQFKNTTLDIDIKKIDLQLDFSCLLDAKLCLDHLSLNQPHIDLKSHSHKTKINHHSDFNLPIALQVKNISVDNLSFNSPFIDIKLGFFKTGFFANKNQGIHVLPTEINDVILNFPEYKKHKDIKNVSSSKSIINWEKIKEQLNHPILTEDSFIKLPFNLNIMDFSAKNWRLIQGKKDIFIKQLNVKTEGSPKQIRIKTFNLDSDIGIVTGQGWINTDDDYPIDLLIKINTPKLDNSVLFENMPFIKSIFSKENNLKFSLNGELKNSTKLELNLKGIAPLQLDGQANLTVAKTPLKVKVVSHSFQYPFNKKLSQSYIFKNLNIGIGGNLLNYSIILSGQMKDKKLPTSSLNAYARGSLTQLDVKNILLQIGQGKVNFNGRLNWYHGLKWKTNLKLDHFKFGHYTLKDLPGILSGKLSAYGIIRNNEWAVNVPEIDLKGTLSQQNFLLNTSLIASNEKPLDIQHFLLDYGKNHIEGKGYLSKHSQLEFILDAPNLKGLLPTLEANLKGNIKISGEVFKPDVDFDLIGKDIAFQRISLKHININTNLQSENMLKGFMQISLKDLKFKDLKITQLDMMVKGNEQAHSFVLHSQGEPIALNFDLNGSFNRDTQQWEGNLKSINIPTIIGKWDSNKPIDITYNHINKDINISAHCWENEDGYLCFDKSIKAGEEGDASFKIKKLNLALINQFIKPNFVKGLIDGKGNIQWFSDKPIEGYLSLSSYNLVLKSKIDYRHLQLKIPKFRVFSKIKNNQLNLQNFIYIEDQGHIDTNIKVKDLTHTKDLTGSLQIHDISLNIAQQLLSKGERLDGNISADLSLAGNLQDPQLNGDFLVNNIQAKIKTMPFDIVSGDLALEFFGDYSTLEGNLVSKESRLNIYGRTDWQDLDNWHSELDVTAKDFYLDLPMLPTIAKVKITPDIYIKAEPHLLTLSGNIDIPWARIDVVDLPDSGIPVSSDLVILNGPNKSKPNKLIELAKTGETTKGTRIESDLQISIGDNVNLKAYGLNTYLKGLLSVSQQKGIFGLYGQVELDRGSYKSFGQDLLIQKGHISFSGIASKPTVNIEAIRNPSAMEDKDITAGIIVSGYATKPNIKVFSNPIMSQDQAFSYLLTGHSIENNGDENSGASIGTALLAMSLAQSGKVVGDIGKVFGVQNLNVGTAGVGDNSKVEVSGNLTQDLQVKYGIGLFNGLAELTLRYRLLPRLYLQTVSSVNQAVDLLYQFEI